MYARPTSRPDNPHAFARALIHEHPFGVIVVASPERGLHASHIPFLLTSAPDEQPIRVAGHLARANDLTRHIQAAPEILAIFSGPHTFISSSWYQRDDVATWNYAAVHIHARARVMPPDELRAHVLAVTHRFEGAPEAGGKAVSPESLDKLVPAIVGFELTAHRVECALKMSQNKPDDEYARVLAGLDKRNTPADADVARIMRTLRNL